MSRRGKRCCPRGNAQQTRGATRDSAAVSLHGSSDWRSNGNWPEAAIGKQRKLKRAGILVQFFEFCRLVLKEVIYRTALQEVKN